MAGKGETLSIPQPEGDPINFDNQYGAVDQYQAAFRSLGGRKRRAPEVAPHLLANVVQSANSLEVPNDDIVRIAKDLQAADEIVREVPRTPIVYRLHCGDAVGITPDEGTTGFRVADTGTGGMKHMQTVIPTQQLFSMRKGANFEDPETVTEGEDLHMYNPLHFLTSDDPRDIVDFLDFKAKWTKYPNSQVVVGQSAVTAFIREQARREVIGEAGRTDTRGLIDGWALLTSAALKRMGHDSPIGKHGDFVHQAGLEGVADIIANGLGYSSDLLLWDQGDRIMRRLTGIDFDPQKDAVQIGEKAVERLISGDETSDRKPPSRFKHSVYGDRSQLTSYLTDTAGNFLTSFVVKSPQERVISGS